MIVSSKREDSNKGIPYALFTQYRSRHIMFLENNQLIINELP